MVYPPGGTGRAVSLGGLFSVLRISNPPLQPREEVLPQAFRKNGWLYHRFEIEPFISPSPPKLILILPLIVGTSCSFVQERQTINFVFFTGKSLHLPLLVVDITLFLGP